MVESLHLFLLAYAVYIGESPCAEGESSDLRVVTNDHSFD